ncbi:glycosyltransferase [Agrilactobacillus yilanensis]|uniref:Glycosyltransferase n=1 Tax=Agrilactobacillus yilanensis TaxID=2485997 RepID=A0ABW4JAA5_9LACO|nr:glycosyltransferase [Agrilactobacillus yilanensis]
MILKILLLISLIYFLILLFWFVGMGSVALYKSRHLSKHYDIKQPHQLFLFVPALNEQAVIVDTITSELKQLRLLPTSIAPCFVIIDDASNDGTTEILQQLSDPLLYVIHRKKPQAQTGKGDALNDAFQRVQQTFKPDQQAIYGVLDADAFMAATDLENVIYCFENRDVQLIQTNIGMSNYNDNWITRGQDFEFFANNALIQSIRNITHTAIASGNGQFMTQSYLDAVTWGNSLLEDCEFTIRGFLKGYQTYFLRSAIVYQQAIDELRPLMTQRTRWCQGSLQCIPRYLGALIFSKKMMLIQKLDIILFLLVPIAGITFIISNTVSIFVQLWLMYLYRYFIVLMILMVIVFLFWCYLVYIYSYRAHQQRVISAFFFFVLNTCLSAIPFRALGRLALNRKDWVKTVHKVNTPMDSI